MLRIVSDGVQRNLSLRFKSLVLYTTESTSPEQPAHFMVDYLVDSLGFSREQAAVASKKVSCLKSPDKPDSVINFFKQIGFTQSQIQYIAFHNTDLLSICNVDKTLAPKIRTFLDLGFSNSDLGTVLASNPSILRRRLDAHIKPLIETLRSILGTDENVIRAMKRSFRLLSCNVPNRLLGNVSLLKSYGLSDERIRKLVMNNPRNLVYRPEVLEASMRTVEEDFGIPRQSGMFIHGIDAFSSISKHHIEAKFRILKSYGWRRVDIMTLVRNLPHCLKVSEAKMKRGLDFYMKELGYKPDYISSNPKLLMYGMKSRVLPRKALWEALIKKKLLKTKLSFCSVLSITDKDFLNKYVIPFEDELPELCEAFITKRCLSSSSSGLVE